MSLITDDSLIWASSSSFSARCFSRVRSWIRVRRYRVRSRSSRCRARRDERGPQHAPLSEPGQPHAVELVGLRPSRHVLDVPGVHQPALGDAVLEQVERRLPVRAGRLHHHRVTPWQPASPAAPAAPASPSESTDLLPPRTRPPSCGTRTQHTRLALPISSAATRATSSPRSSIVFIHRLSLPDHGLPDGRPREPRGSEAESRAQGNNAGPLEAAPSVRLFHGLCRHQQQPTSASSHTPIFTPCRTSPPGDTADCFNSGAPIAAIEVPGA